MTLTAFQLDTFMEMATSRGPPNPPKKTRIVKQSEGFQIQQFLTDDETSVLVSWNSNFPLDPSTKPTFIKNLIQHSVSRHPQKKDEIVALFRNIQSSPNESYRRLREIVLPSPMLHIGLQMMLNTENTEQKALYDAESPSIASVIGLDKGIRALDRKELEIFVAAFITFSSFEFTPTLKFCDFKYDGCNKSYLKDLLYQISLDGRLQLTYKELERDCRRLLPSTTNSVKSNCFVTWQISDAAGTSFRETSNSRVVVDISQEMAASGRVLDDISNTTIDRKQVRKDKATNRAMLMSEFALSSSISKERANTLKRRMVGHEIAHYDPKSFFGDQKKKAKKAKSG